ncbi:hypothetical protein MKZ38_007821 [Zalerion maritima]|uniref:Pre-rRNA-processing protein n=1 Tax=Zalerion maritima TaxID=339359 RepID=A0AAD5RHR3_9PEZI|nr:hypothetical protein MKZ38_007821 [Zalerion maritima]
MGGASAKKKKEKKKDFQKPKFKVGKTKAKASNFTDTSFKSKGKIGIQHVLFLSSITVNQLLPGADADDPIAQFKHNLSLTTSRSENQRTDGLKYLAARLEEDQPYNPVGSLQVLLKVLPLMSDSSSAVRTQLLKLLKTLPIADVKPYVEKIVLYARAAMTNLSSEISEDATAVLDWLVEVAPEEVVSAPGCWVKPLNCFVTVLRWSSYLDASSSKADAKKTRMNTAGKANGGWSAASQMGMSSAKKKQAQTRQIVVLGKFLKAGFRRPKVRPDTKSGEERLLESIYVAPREPNAFSHLNVFGQPRDEDDMMYMDRESRRRVFTKKVGKAVEKGIMEMKKEGGQVGRAANELEKVVRDGLLDGDRDIETKKVMEFGDFKYSLKGLIELW